MKYLVKRYFAGQEFESTTEVIKSNLDTKEFIESLPKPKLKPIKVEIYKFVAEVY